MSWLIWGGDNVYLRIAAYLVTYYFHYLLWGLFIILVVLCHRTKLFSRIYHYFLDHKIFFLMVIGAATLVSLRCYPFTALVYGDELNYVNQAQNIIEYHRAGLCWNNENGKCTGFFLATSGPGASSMYSLLYDRDYESFYKRIGVLNLALYVVNAFIIFVIARMLLHDTVVAMVASVLVTMVPYNIIYSTAVAPDSPSNSFFLLAVYALVNLFDRGQTFQLRKDSAWLLVVSLVVLCSFRVEYTLLLGAALLSILAVCALAMRRKGSEGCGHWRWLHILAAAWVLLGVVMLFGFLFYYASDKIPTGGYLDLSLLNSSYVKYYFSSISFLLLTGFFVVYLIYFSVRSYLRRRIGLGGAVFVLSAVFFLYLAFYSLYSWQYVYRFIIPITSIYVLFASAGLVLVVRLLMWRKVAPYVALIILVLISVGLVRSAFKEKAGIVESVRCPEHLLHVIQKSNLDKLTNSTSKAYYFFRDSYFLQNTRVDNYTNSYSTAIDALKSGRQLYYIDYLYDPKITNPDPFDRNHYEYRLLYNDTLCRQYYVYKIKEKLT
jgi:hypothetical protein